MAAADPDDPRVAAAPAWSGWPGVCVVVDLDTAQEQVHDALRRDDLPADSRARLAPLARRLGVAPDPPT